jgi:hypothetical protein
MFPTESMLKFEIMEARSAALYAGGALDVGREPRGYSSNAPGGGVFDMRREDDEIGLVRGRV